MPSKKNNSNHEVSEDMRTLVTVLLLIFVFPVGLIVMWFWPRWRGWVKVLISLPLILLFLVLFIGVLNYLSYKGINKFNDQEGTKNKVACEFKCENEINKDDCVTKCLLDYLDK